MHGRVMRRQAAFASMGLCWVLLAGFAPPAQPVLRYDPRALTANVPLDDVVTLGSQPVEPGEQYPPGQQDRVLEPRVSEPARQAPASPVRGTEWKLTVDASVIADSNVTNATDLHSVDIDYGNGPLPVPLDPNLRARGGVGVGVSAAAGVRLPVSKTAALALDTEGYAVEYEGGRTDDESVLLAAGGEFKWADGSRASLQAVAFDRWYGGITVSRGVGIRGNYRHQLEPGQQLTLYVDARIFESDYGDAFGGEQASVYLSYDTVLHPTLSATLGLYARREWLGEDAYSSRDFGVYGGLNHYLSDHLTGGLSMGIGRILFDAPVQFLSPDPREDWRLSASAYLTTRKPIGWGLLPSITYTYNRAGSSIRYYDSDRHRLRLGLLRKF